MRLRSSDRQVVVFEVAWKDEDVFSCNVIMVTADHVGGEYGVERACRFAFPDGGVCGLHPPQRKNVTVLPTTMMLAFAAAVMFTSPEEQVFSRVTAAVGKLNAWMQARMRGLVATANALCESLGLWGWLLRQAGVRTGRSGSGAGVGGAAAAAGGAGGGGGGGRGDGSESGGGAAIVGHLGEEEKVKAGGGDVDEWAAKAKEREESFMVSCRSALAGLPYTERCRLLSAAGDQLGRGYDTTVFLVHHRALDWLQRELWLFQNGRITRQREAQFRRLQVEVRSAKEKQEAEHKVREQALRVAAQAQKDDALHEAARWKAEALAATRQAQEQKLAELRAEAGVAATRSDLEAAQAQLQVLLRERDAETAAAAEATKERDHAKVLCLFAYVHALCCVVVLRVGVCVCVCACVCDVWCVCLCMCVLLRSE